MTCDYISEIRNESDNLHKTYRIFIGSIQFAKTNKVFEQLITSYIY